MNSHQRRKIKRQKEREAIQIEQKMIPNPTLTSKAHPQGRTIQAIYDYLKSQDIPKSWTYHDKNPHSRWHQFLCSLDLHCRKCAKENRKLCCRCEGEL